MALVHVFPASVSWSKGGTALDILHTVHFIPPRPRATGPCVVFFWTFLVERTRKLFLHGTSPWRLFSSSLVCIGCGGRLDIAAGHGMLCSRLDGLPEQGGFLWMRQYY